jgi:hypothetical protein
MDKGIRPFCDAKFVELLPTRVNVMEAFGCTLASAATHYNHSFIQARKNPELAALLVGLGRPEDKKGGRKKKVVAVVETPAAAAVTTETATETPAQEPVQSEAPAVELTEQEQTEVTEELQAEQAAVTPETPAETPAATMWPFAADGTNTVTGKGKRKGKKSE